MRKWAISILAFNRPDILRKCLDSLASNDLTNVDVHLWLDGGAGIINGQTVHSDLANLTVFEDADIGARYSHVSKVNVGYTGQYARIFPAMMADYERFVVLDDDVVWGSHTVAIMSKLFEQFKDDPRVGGVNPGMKLYCDPTEIGHSWDKVILDRGFTRSLCTEGYWSTKMMLAWKWYSEYLKVVEPWNYWDLALPDARAAVTKWAKSIGSDMLEVSPDSALVRAINQAGQLRMVTVVNRATNIGDYGVHCTPDLLKQLGIGHQPIPECEAGLAISKFRIVE
jgi:GT2 family glycosyltransferase